MASATKSNGFERVPKKETIGNENIKADKAAVTTKKGFGWFGSNDLYVIIRGKRKKHATYISVNVTDSPQANKRIYLPLHNAAQRSRIAPYDASRG